MNRALVQRLRSGDVDALEEAYDLHHRGIYRFCLKMLVDHDEAQDAVQDVFLSVLADIRSLRDDTRFAPWLFRIAHNRCLMLTRRKKGERLDTIDENVWSDETPLDESSRHDIEGQVRVALDGMTRVFREVIHLRVYEQLSYAEIAAVLDTTEAAVRARLFKARKALALRLNHLMNER